MQLSIIHYKKIVTAFSLLFLNAQQVNWITLQLRNDDAVYSDRSHNLHRNPLHKGTRHLV